jgi:hypothetical protein
MSNPLARAFPWLGLLLAASACGGHRTGTAATDSPADRPNPDAVVSTDPAVTTASDQAFGSVPAGGSTPVPEPTTILLAGSGLVFIAWTRRRRRPRAI